MKWLVTRVAAGAVVLAGMTAFASPATAQPAHRQPFLPTLTTVTASPATVPVGGTSTLTAVVRCFGAPPGSPSGSVSFFDTTVPAFLGSAPVVTTTPTGTATISATFTAPVGAHNITAAYSGDFFCQPSTGSTTVTVGSAVTSTTTLAASTTTPFPFQPVTFTAMVSCTAGSPVGGTVTFTDNGIPFATRTVTGTTGSPTGTATVTRSFLFGIHVIRATFNGTPSCGGSTSNAVTIRVRFFSVGPFSGDGAGATAGQPAAAPDEHRNRAVRS